MKASTREWVAKAEEDFSAATILAKPRKKPLWGAACFHAQQCVGKYLKARLNEASLPIHKTHDSEHLLLQASVIEPLWAAFRPELKRLTDAAISPRYPGNPFRKPEAQRALKTSKAFRAEARLGLGLPAK
jgi:HEPN domain-containing protein